MARELSKFNFTTFVSAVGEPGLSGSGDVLFCRGDVLLRGRVPALGLLWGGGSVLNVVVRGGGPGVVGGSGWLLGGLSPLLLGGLSPLLLGGLSPLLMGGLSPLLLGGLSPRGLGSVLAGGLAPRVTTKGWLKGGALPV